MMGVVEFRLWPSDFGTLALYCRLWALLLDIRPRFWELGFWLQTLRRDLRRWILDLRPYTIDARSCKFRPLALSSRQFGG